LSHQTNSLSFGEGWGEALPSGIYFIKINNNKLVKVIKK
jgi:hypothetical protein